MITMENQLTWNVLLQQLMHLMQEIKTKDVDTLKLSSGDIMIGEDFKTNQLAVMFQKKLE